MKLMSFYEAEFPTTIVWVNALFVYAKSITQEQQTLKKKNPHHAYLDN